MDFLAKKISSLFDPLLYFWEHEKIHRKISSVLVALFLTTVILIELNRNRLFPLYLSTLLPENHFYAVHYAFTVVLILEVISLIFTLPCSFSQSVGKQFQILSLILLRNAFKELALLPEPVTFQGLRPEILHIVSNGFGALIIFALLGYYYSCLSKTQATEESMTREDLFRFVAAKKGIAIILLILFFYMGINSGIATFHGVEHTDFFHDFYTVLILTDILIVLLYQCYHPSFFSIFRNSGFALATLLIRLALAAPPYFNTLLGIAAEVFAISLVLITTRITTIGQKRQIK